MQSIINTFKNGKGCRYDKQKRERTRRLSEYNNPYINSCRLCIAQAITAVDIGIVIF